jgi:cyanophycin synthetase
MIFNIIIQIIIYLCIIIFYYCLNKYLNIKENYEGIVSDNFFKELDKRNIEYNKDDKSLILDGNKIIFKNHFNSKESTINAKNKVITSNILSSNNIPIPKFVEIDLSLNLDEINEILKKKNIKYPVVMKPINGTFGIDVITDIDNINEMKNAIELLKKYKKVILEQQISGDCYRIFVFNNKVIDVIKREKPFIIGDNIHTINELIELRNQENIDMGLLPIKNVSKLLINKQGYSMESILKKGDKVIISNVINMHNGARINRIPLKKIPPENIELFIKVNKVMDIKCSGLDYLSNDITIPYHYDNSKILEVNGTPDTEIHNKIAGFNFFEKLIDSL